MKPSALFFALSVTSSMAFSMISPRGFFPQRFEKYLEDVEDIFDKDWPNAFMEEQLNEFKKTLSGTEKALTKYRTTSPKYEIMDTSDKFEVKIDVPGFKPDEVDVEIRAGGRLLTVTGNHEEKDQDSLYSSKFQQNFSLDPSIMIDDFTANFQDGQMHICAPRKVEFLPESHKIPIMIEGKADTKKDTKVKKKKEQTP
eukprot:104298_1